MFWEKRSWRLDNQIFILNIKTKDIIFTLGSLKENLTEIMYIKPCSFLLKYNNNVKFLSFNKYFEPVLIDVNSSIFSSYSNIPFLKNNSSIIFNKSLNISQNFYEKYVGLFKYSTNKHKTKKLSGTNNKNYYLRTAIQTKKNRFYFIGRDHKYCLWNLGSLKIIKKKAIVKNDFGIQSIMFIPNGEYFIILSYNCFLIFSASNFEIIHQVDFRFKNNSVILNKSNLFFFHQKIKKFDCFNLDSLIQQHSVQSKELTDRNNFLIKKYYNLRTSKLLSEEMNLDFDSFYNSNSEIPLNFNKKQKTIFNKLEKLEKNKEEKFKKISSTKLLNFYEEKLNLFENFLKKLKTK